LKQTFLKVEKKVGLTSNNNMKIKKCLCRQEGIEKWPIPQKYENKIPNQESTNDKLRTCDVHSLKLIIVGTKYRFKKNYKHQNISSNFKIFIKWEMLASGQV
jgi:hypothetical protein